MVVVVDTGEAFEPESVPSKVAGFDFGLKTFLNCFEGFSIKSPQFFKQSLKAIQKASRTHVHPASL